MLSTELFENEGNKKNVQAKLDTFPVDIEQEVGDAEMQSEDQRQEEAKGEETEGGQLGFTPPSDLFE